MRMLAFLGFFMLVFSSQLLAANCGGTTPCKCGDTVKQDYVMTADLGPCPGHGLTIADGVTLDGNNHEITGAGNATENYGVYLKGTTGAVVKNVVVTGFRRGIRLSDAQGNQILNTETFQNGNFSTHVGYGIDMASGAKGNLLQGNLIHHNADEGIHFGSGSGENAFIGNTVYDNYLENIYLIASHDNTLLGNATRLGQTSVYLKDSHGNVLQDNTFQDRIVHIRGDAYENRFINNTLDGAGFHFQVYTKDTPFRYPHDNSVHGGRVSVSGGVCIRFSSSWNNVVSDTVLSGCGTDLLLNSDEAQSRNTIIGVRFNSKKVQLEGSSLLAVGWRLDARVQDVHGNPVGNASLSVSDVTSALLFEDVTDLDGNIPTQDVIAYVKSKSGQILLTPIMVRVTKAGFQADSRQIELNGDSALIFTLSSVSSPTNAPPIAEAGRDQTVSVTDIVSFDGSGSHDPDGDALTYSWDFGDGSTGSGMIVSHEYPTAGNYTVTLHVNDGKGGVGTDSVAVMVKLPPEPLAASLTSPASNVSLVIGAHQDFSGSATGGVPPYTYTWEFPGATSLTGSGPGPLTRTYSVAGTYTASLTVSDAATPPNTDTVTVQVTVETTDDAIIIDSPVLVNKSETKVYQGDVIVRDAGLFQANFASGSFTIVVEGDLTLEGGATRIRTSRENLTGSVFLDVRGNVIVKGVIDAAGTKWGGTNGGDVTIECATFTLQSGGVIKTTGGGVSGKAGAITITAAHEATFHGTGNLSATGAYGGNIQVTGDVIGGTGGVIKATGKLANFAGTITLSYTTAIDTSKLLFAPLPIREKRN